MTQPDPLIQSPSDATHDLIADDAALSRQCAIWAREPWLCLDTEFIRTTTFYPKPGLIQVRGADRNVLVDPLGITDWSAFRALLADPRIVKILHSCSEDLLVFYSFLGVIPAPLFDTQLAAAYLDQGLSLSYQNLVKEKTGIELPKGETRSDWLQRPLSEEQLHYAALDVAYLPEIYRLQTEQLEREDKLAWLEEDCERLLRQYDDEISGDFSEYYRNIKGAWQLNRRQLAALQRLAQWREERARKRDKPRSWIVKDLQLLDIARTLPQGRQALQALPEISPNLVKFEGDAILAITREVRDLKEELFPEALPKPLTGEQKQRLRAAQDFVDAKARELRMSPDVLARKRALLAFQYGLLRLRKQPERLPGEELLCLPEELKGWRRELLYDDLLRLLDGD